MASCTKQLMIGHAHTPNHLITGPTPVRCSVRCRCSSSTLAGVGPTKALHESEVEKNVRMQLARSFPNALLLEGNRLPSLYSSKHFVNLTNGLEMLPLLQQLQLPFSALRIRSTSLEQQAFESMMLELDANFLLALALGHSCVVWDAGCRHRKSGAPRALWYGLEFIRFALQRFWLGEGGPAHLRGHDVSREFEKTCRSFHPSTKTRLRYYKRYISPQVQEQGVTLAGAFRRTDRDEDVQHFVQIVRQFCGLADDAAEGSSSVQCGRPVVPQYGEDNQVGPACEGIGQHTQPAGQSLGFTCTHGAGVSRDVQLDKELWAYELLLNEQISMFTAGLSHSDFANL